MNKVGPARGQRATIGCLPTTSLFHCHMLVHYFYFYFFCFFIWSYEVLLGIWREWVHGTPIFSSFPLHLEVSNLPFLIMFGYFTFLGNFIFPKFRVDPDLHIYRSDFCFMEN
jgi:hypothetical protein